MRMFFPGVAGILLLFSAGIAAAERPVCDGSPKLIGACFPVHARLSYVTPLPHLRLVTYDTRQMFAVDDGDRAGRDIPRLPASVSKHFQHRWESTEVSGDYTVCPLTEPRPDYLPLVCIESGTNLVVRRHPAGG